ncbi:MAG: Nre family DNA repair protein [Desulfurococcaceae archaeon]
MKISPNLCVICRGRGLCGLAYCPILARQEATFRLSKISDRRDLFGSTPPSAFVGRAGYPRVRFGIFVPPETGDTSIYDMPERWLDLDMNEILRLRLSMVLGYTHVDVREAPRRIVEDLTLAALSERPVDVEVSLRKPPKPTITLSEHEPPMGPRERVLNARLASEPKISNVVERVVEDELKAQEAVIALYNNKLPISYIQRLLSIGALGKRVERRLVPTRWSITAVDAMVSDWLLESVRRLPVLDKYMVYLRAIYDNLFVGILAPRPWGFEWMEAWWPGSTWNAFGSQVEVEGDHEGFNGRRTYPSIGGCYYASRLATAEHELYRLGKQAMAILLREIGPGFDIPIGVWFVRENARRMFAEGPALVTDDLREVMEFLDHNTKLGAKKWYESSRLLKRLSSETSITKYVR